jgi:DNA-binding MarR family transcriptional regulator
LNDHTYTREVRSKPMPPTEHPTHDTAPPDADPLQQWAVLQSTFHRLTNRLFDEVTRRTGLPASSAQVLLQLLQSSPPHSVQMTHLARSLEFSTAGVTKLTDRLVTAGLIERSPSGTDRRIVRATLTASGHEVAQLVADTLLDALNREVIRKIGRKRFARLASLFTELDDAR